MAVFETWLKNDLKKPVIVELLQGNLFSGDNGGNIIGVEVYDNGAPASLSGGVTGYAIRADGATVAITGTLSGNRASIVLPASAYTVIGPLSIVIKNGTTTLGACTAYVYRTTTDTIVDPGHVIPSIEELLAKIADCEAATTAANTAASSANTAASNANTKANLADQKATLADQKATAANTAATAANTAATKIDDMTVAAQSGTTAGAVISEVSGHKHIQFTLPKGDPGDATIDDDAGEGDTTEVWSADKLVKKFSGKADTIDVQIDTPASVMTFSDGGDGYPLSATFEIAPVQDLHGQANPYPGGAGKNLIPPFGNKWVTGNTTSYYGVKSSDSVPTFPFTFTTSGTSAHTNVPVYVFACKSSTKYSITPPTGMKAVVAEYANLADISSQSNALARWGDSSTTTDPITKTTEATANYLVIGFSNYGGSSSITLGETAQFQLEEGNATSYAPYENLCPITGWTGCKPSRTGKNLIPDGTDTSKGFVSGYYLKSDGTTGSAAANNISEYFRVKGGATYTWNSGSQMNAGSICFYDGSKTFISGVNGGNALPKVINVPANAVYARSTVFASTYLTQFEIGGTATEIVPYRNGIEYAISFPVGAGTVYGGALTVNKDGSGVLRDTYLVVEMDGVTSGRKVTSKGGSGNNYYYERSANSTFGTGKSKWVPMNVLLENNVKSNMFPTGDPATLGSTATLIGAYIGSNGNYQPRFSFDPTVFPNITTVETANAWFAEQYNNGTPVTHILVNKTATVYNLTAEEVGQIFSLKGVNNLFCDTGDVLSVNYSADTTLYVNERNAEHDEQISDVHAMIATSDAPVATANHAVGDVFICNDQLVRATSSIASGETVNTGSGGNAEVINLAEYIAEQVTAIAGLQTDVTELKKLPTAPSYFLLKELGFKDFTVSNAYYGTIKLESNVLTASGGSGSTYYHINLLGTNRVISGTWANYTPLPEDFAPISNYFTDAQGVANRKFVLRITGKKVVSPGEATMRVVVMKKNGDDTYTYKYAGLGTRYANLPLNNEVLNLSDWDGISIVLTSQSRPLSMTTYLSVEDGDGGTYEFTTK